MHSTGDETATEHAWRDAPRDCWQEWSRSRSAASRGVLIEHYLPLARALASHLYRRYSDGVVAFDDYLQYARVGLLEALERYDVSLGAPFSAFARHRIRGAVLNGLVRESDGSAQRDARRRIANERRTSLLGTETSAAGVRSLEEFIDLTVGLAIGAILDGEHQLVDNSVHANPYEATEVAQIRRLAWEAVEQLPGRERGLIIAHYVEQREFADIAVSWSLSPGRISQLHKRALAGLRQQLTGAAVLNREV